VWQLPWKEEDDLDTIFDLKKTYYEDGRFL
jgi:hypothetical protein